MSAKKAHILVGLILLVCGALQAQNLPPRDYTFSWQAVEGAGGYLADVRDLSENPIASQNVPASTHKVTFQLVPGPYQLRLTTLNRLLQPESATDWLPIHVAAAAAPIVGDIDRMFFSPGEAPSLSIAVTGLAQDAIASVRTPSGKTVVVEMSAPDNGAVQLSLPPLGERGDYALDITNPPALTKTITGRISVHYPKPQVESITPTKIQGSAVAQAIHVVGKDFTPESLVVLQGADGSSVELSIDSHSATELVAIVPPTVAASAYTVMVANAHDELPVQGGTVIVEAPPQFGRAAAATGGLEITLLADGTVNLAGKQILVVAGSPLSVSDIGVGEVPIHVAYADGKTEDRIVSIVEDTTTKVAFSYTVSATQGGEKVAGPDQVIALLSAARQKEQNQVSFRKGLSLTGWIGMTTGAVGSGICYYLGWQEYSKYKAATTTKSADAEQALVEAWNDVVIVGLGVGIVGALLGTTEWWTHPTLKALQASIESLNEQIEILKSQETPPGAKR